MEPNQVKPDNTESKSNYKPRGVRGLAHKLKQGFRSVRNGFQDSFRNGMKMLWAAVISAIAPYLIAAIAILIFASAALHAIQDNSQKQIANSVDSYFSSGNYTFTDEASKNAQNLYNDTGSLVLATDKDIKNMGNELLTSIRTQNSLLYEALVEEKYIGSHKIADIPYADGFDINNAVEFMLNSERMNFNRIVWKAISRDGDPTKIKDVKLKTDKETNLKYPDNDDDEKELEDFVKMVAPYLQSYIVPSSMASGITSTKSGDNTGNFIYQIVDKAYHQIQINQYTLENVTKHKAIIRYIEDRITLQLYKKFIPATCYDEDDKPYDCSYYIYGYYQTELETKTKQLFDQYYETIKKGALGEEYFEKGTTLDTAKFPAVIKDKDIVYGMVEAETIKNYTSIEYEQILYNQEEVDAFENAKGVSVVNTEKYETVNSELQEALYAIGNSYSPITSLMGWSSDGSVTFSAEVGEDITHKYYWQDDLKIKETIQRNYTVDDIVYYLNTESIEKTLRSTEHVIENEEEKSEEQPEGQVTEQETTEEPGVDGETEQERQEDTKQEEKFGVSLNFSDREYYESLEKDAELTKIDIINAKPEVYNDYLQEGTRFSINIGYSRSRLKTSYQLMQKYLASYTSSVDYNGILSDLKKNISNLQILGLGYVDLVWPIASYGTITSYVGEWRPQLGQYYGHSGLDIVSTGDEPYDKSYTGGYIYSSTSGVVTGIFKETPRDQGNVSSKCPDTAQGAGYQCGGSGYGRHVKIYDPDTGYTIVYGHLYEVADGIEVGSNIEQGQVIGVMGTTGSSTGVHLHFEVRKPPGYYSNSTNPLVIPGFEESRESLK